MLLYCIRHGETKFNASGRIQGQSDSPLSELGWQQCRAAAQALKAAGIDALYSSPLTRAVDSAGAIADACNVRMLIEPRLMEINAGIFQGKDWDQIEREHPAEAIRWKDHDPDFVIPGGESRRQLMQRAKAAFTEIRAGHHEKVAIVAHGGLLNAAFKALLDIPAERNPFALGNGSISRIVWNAEVKLLTLNEADHLGDKLSGNGEL